VNTEADSRKFVVPRLQTAGWEGAPHAINERRTGDRVIFIGGKAKRGRQKRADYVLRYRADYPSGMNARGSCFRKQPMAAPACSGATHAGKEQPIARVASGYRGFSGYL
jgi:hypothetical protein